MAEASLRPVIWASDNFGELRFVINDGDISANSEQPTVIEIENFDRLELHDVTLRIDGDRPAEPR
ncbi:MAG: hypothetical protein EA424_28060 [Planctomycetaceae bacterium]|nr:MAG: hypothetical protein EA424_28060 [Planctomycetaceae bacterium]